MGKERNSFLMKRREWMKLSFFLAFFLLFGVFNASAQSVSGVVKDATHSVITGVVVRVEGTQRGTITDNAGKYKIAATAGDKISFSYMGMKKQEVTVGSSNAINIVMLEDEVSTTLNSAIVIGYGSAKAKDLTSSIPTVRADVLEKNLTASPMQGLQGRVPGVQIINTGAPGDSPVVHVRGVGTFGDANPLYVVDGMFFGNIDFLSNNDIESISILKDASSCAIYGVRAANGVVIVTTKKGILNQKATITYDGYVGFQTATNVVKMANSAEYAQMMTETGDPAFPGRVANSITRYGGANGVPSTNTDWYGQLLKTATIQSHSVNIRGGGDRTTYSFTASYLDQNGIMNVDNNFKRVNTRTRIDTKVASWLKVGGNIGIINSSQVKPQLSAFGQAFMAPPIFPVYDSNNKAATPIDYASPSDIGYSSTYANPVAMAHYFNSTRKVFQVLPSFYAELSLLNDKLTFRSSFSQDINLARSSDFTPQYVVGANQRVDINSLTKTDDYVNHWILDNVVTYKLKSDKNNFTFMAGNSFRNKRTQMLQGINEGVSDGADEYHYLDTGSYTTSRSLDGGGEDRGLSYFARMLYNYDDKYLLSATFRADGSSKFQEKWGYFPSIGLGWVLSKENFMANQKVFNFLKLRGNWGQLGNDKVLSSDGFSSIIPNEATFGDILVPGFTNPSLFSYLKWEILEETDLGFDFTTLNNRLSATFDWYNRITKNAIFHRPYAFGTGSIYVNNGKVQNTGIEFNLDWKDKIGKDFTYNVGFNMSTVNNKVTSLDGLTNINTGIAEYQTVRRIGYPMESFLGYKVVGVYQNAAQVAADPVAVANNLQPGDFIYQHADPNQLLPSDRIILGSPLPTLTLGGNLGFGFKNWDFSLAYSGQFGGKIVNVKRAIRKLQGDMNYDEDLVKNHWTGEGSTNSYPSAAGLNNPWNLQFNSFLAESSNSFTIQNVQLGYTFQNITRDQANKVSLRLSLTAQHPLSFFKYNGFTTELQNGLDQNMYPLASTYSFGVKLIY